MKNTLNKIEELYSNLLNKHGNQSNAVGWNTSECQNLRFQKLTSVIKNSEDIYSINDYGCGYGAHLDYLIEKGFKINCYNGYDVSKPMLKEAKKSQEKHNLKLNLHQTQNIITLADYTFVSGTFNVKFETSEKEWKFFIQEKLEEINRFSRIGFSFNILTSYVEWKEDHLYYGDPLFWFDLCKKSFSKKVSLIHDYPLWEWTICVTK